MVDSSLSCKLSLDNSFALCFLFSIRVSRHTLVKRPRLRLGSVRSSKQDENASPADLRRPKARWRGRADNPAVPCLEGLVFGDTLEKERKKKDVGTVANLAGAAKTQSRINENDEMKTPVDLRQPKSRHKISPLSSGTTKSPFSSKQIATNRFEIALTDPDCLQPKDRDPDTPRRRVTVEDFLRVDAIFRPTDRGPCWSVFLASRRTDSPVHCPHLTSRNSTRYSLTTKVRDGSEPVLTQSNPPCFSSSTTRTDAGSDRTSTGIETPADLRQLKDRGPFLSVLSASRQTDPPVHCPHLTSRNSTLYPLNLKACAGSESSRAQRNPSRLSSSTTRTDNGSDRTRTGTEIPADLRQPKDRDPFLSVLSALRRPDPRPLPPLAIKEWYDVPSTNYGVRWLCTVLVQRTPWRLS